MQPTNGKPYEFETLQQVLDILDMCFGRESLLSYAKIIEIKENGST